MMMTREDLARSIEASLREADRLGLVHVGIRLNDAIVAMDNVGLHPLEPATLFDAAPTAPPLKTEVEEQTHTPAP